MAKHAVAIGDYLEDAENFSNGLLVFKPQFSRRLSRVFFSASSRLSRNFRGQLAGLAQIAAARRLSQPLMGLFSDISFVYSDKNCLLSSMLGAYARSERN